jgi:hypothetical protein
MLNATADRWCSKHDAGRPLKRGHCRRECSERCGWQECGGGHRRDHDDCHGDAGRGLGARVSLVSAASFKAMGMSGLPLTQVVRMRLKSTERPMPPAMLLTAAEIAPVVQWAEAGAIPDPNGCAVHDPFAAGTPIRRPGVRERRSGLRASARPHRYEAVVHMVDKHAEAHLWSSPIYVAESNLIIVGVASGEEAVQQPYIFRGNVVGLDAKTGAERWRFYTTTGDAASGPGVGVWATVAIDAKRKLAFVGTGQRVLRQARSARGFDARDQLRHGHAHVVQAVHADDVFSIFGSAGPDFDIGASANMFTDVAWTTSWASASRAVTTWRSNARPARWCGCTT